MEHDKQIEQALNEAATNAGAIQMHHFRSEIATQHKESVSSIDTQVDHQCDEAIIKILLHHFPDYNILSEENGYIDRQSRYTWVVDPLDGTSNYVAGIPWFGILIALFEGNSPLYAGAYLPASNDFYYAKKGGGAYLNGERLLLSPQQLSQTLFAFSTDATTDELYLNIGITFYKYLTQNCRNVRSTNSLLDMLYVADGKFGGCVNLFTKIWDIAAPFLIITEAGGIMLDLSMKPVNFDCSPMNIDKNYGIVAAQSSHMIDELKQLL